MCKKKPTKCIGFAHVSFFVQRFNISNSFFCLLMSNFIIDEGQCSCKRAVLSFGSVCHPDFLLFVSLFLDVDAVRGVMHGSSLQVVVPGVSRGNCGGGYAVGCVGGDGHIVESNDFLRAVGCVDSLKTDGGGCFPVAFKRQFCCRARDCSQCSRSPSPHSLWHHLRGRFSRDWPSGCSCLGGA